MLQATPLFGATRVLLQITPHGAARVLLQVTPYGAARVLLQVTPYGATRVIRNNFAPGYYIILKIPTHSNLKLEYNPGCSGVCCSINNPIDIIGNNSRFSVYT
ncbi:hypothetical protein C2G38_2049644 [Gigaspora rosea]|uniref:Uncharacterized protein n=1 Tax=Gigaspora rosea TaxID=44941 RepID=A0A397TYE9_9GLOM|nr:hypothetical protein C2G38_2049644 [Gigaspora rosea]